MLPHMDVVSGPIFRKYALRLSFDKTQTSSCATPSSPFQTLLRDHRCGWFLLLYTPVPVNSRAAVKTTTFPVSVGPNRTAPVLVHKGEALVYYVYAMHRRKCIHGPESDQFSPRALGK
ncbi:hypothetical protein N7532_002442 [Penicillium argentinense]|uniref:Uncharacterized protein n=1 Tax=Penicillium argentinense TaxID=1131581 RepID=A0A9W9G0H6_9EURO|nr:uncharacterized protein N7532_002442 [Penicillium argentinense]KAJ5109797.1 hypothetical protein N7532_002442 [Penicillium argentinense]